LLPLPIQNQSTSQARLVASKSKALDNVAMLELHEWLNHMRFRLFGDLRPWDQQDAVEETFIRTLEFAYKMRNPGALYGACFTIGLRVRAQRVTEYIRER
jgi:DNA-directed RNA polymerase specialized sigma24 family protein